MNGKNRWSIRIIYLLLLINSTILLNAFPQAEVPNEYETESTEIEQPIINYFANTNLYISILPDPAKVDSQFNSESDVEAFANKSTTSKDYLLVAMYYHFNVLDLINDLPKKKDKKKEYIDIALKYMDIVTKMEPANSVYLAFGAGIFGVRSGYTSYPGLLEYSNKCLKYFSQAVRMDSVNPEVRMQRLLSLINFPYKYYPSLIKTIVKDLEIIEMWANQADKAAMENEELKGYAQWLMRTKYQAFYLLGKYYYEQMKKKDLAKEILVKIPVEAAYYKDAMEILKKL